MPRDYKSYSRSKKKKRSGGNKHAGTWIVAVVLIVAFGYGLYWLSTHRGARLNKVPAITTSKKVAPPSTTAAAPQPPKIKFEFYNLLSKEKVSVPTGSSSTQVPPVVPGNSPSKVKIPAPFAPAKKPVSAPPVSKPAAKVAAKPSPAPIAPAPATSDSYIVQIASVKNYNDADQMKANLTLAGFNMQLEKSNVAGTTWYRVQAGPYNSLAAATAAQSSLRKQNYNAIVKKIK
jgi:cell division protein FtsN